MARFQFKSNWSHNEVCEWQILSIVLTDQSCDLHGPINMSYFKKKMLSVILKCYKSVTETFQTYCTNFLMMPVSSSIVISVLTNLDRKASEHLANVN